MATTRPFNISKQMVWEAYKSVRAKGGSAGIDEQCILEFDKDLKNNLYKLWNIPLSDEKVGFKIKI
jgi:hypothetical protein